MCHSSTFFINYSSNEQEANIITITTVKRWALSIEKNAALSSWFRYVPSLLFSQYAMNYKSYTKCHAYISSRIISMKRWDAFLNGFEEGTEQEWKLKERKNGYTKYTQISEGIIALLINLFTTPPDLYWILKWTRKLWNDKDFGCVCFL